MKSTIFTLISKPQIYPFQDRFGVGETRQQNDDIRTTEILENADHTTQDLSPTLSKLVKQKIKIFALYGQEDVLYSAE